LASAEQSVFTDRRRVRRRLAGGVWVAAALAGLTLPGVAGSAPAATGTGTRPVGAPTKVVTLVTGDRVLLSTGPGGRQTAAAEPRPGRRDSYVTRRVGGDLYVLPAGVVPYLGRSLDMALFDVSALVRDNPDGRIPVRVSYPAGAAQNAPPGVTFTGSGTASARDGYLTPGSAAAFGAALDAQRARDAAAGWVGDRRLYGAVTSIRYAGRGPAAVIRPDFPMVTLQLPVLGTQGEPAPFALLDVVNVDDARRFAATPVVVDGDVRVSVPAGHYAVSLIYPVFDATGETATEIRFAMSEFEVTGAASHVVDARTATSRVSFRTPRPADPQDAKVGFFRGSDEANGDLFLVDAGTAPLFVSPAPAAAVGVRHFYAAGDLTSPAGAAAPYSYRVEYPTDGAVGDQRYVVTAGSLATVTHVFYSEHRQTGGALTLAALPWLGTDFGVLRPLDLPQRHTQYVTASPEIRYDHLAQIELDRGSGSFLQDARSRTYAPRARYTEEWFRQPLAPGFTTPFNTTIGLLLCNACRNLDLLDLSVVPVTDSTPGHFGFLDFPDEGVVSTSRIQLLSGSTVLADEQDTTEVLVSAPAGDAPYRLVYDQTRQAPWFGLSPVSHTEWTFTSAHSAANTIPDGTMCFAADFEVGDACTALSLLTLNYRLGTDLSGAMRPGPASLRLSVAHTAFGPAISVSSATVSVSFDGGGTWTPVVVRSLGGGEFQATWTNPAAAAGPVVLRVEAADAAGSTVSQTVQQPFTITAGGSGA
jgi:hypothetical protein